MTVIYLGRKDRTQTQHSEEELQRMVEAGEVDPSWLYWQEGMPEWRSVSEWIAAHPPKSRLELLVALEEELPGTKLVRPPRLYKEVQNLAWFVLAMLGFYAMSAIGMLVLNIWQAGLIGGPAVLEPAFAVSQVAEAMLTLGTLVIFFVTSISFCLWIYRTKVNVELFGAEGLQTSPGWSVGWFFIPLLNWFKPYQSMKETWQASLSPQNWQTVRPPITLQIWWFLWLFTGVVGFFKFQAEMALAKESAKPALVYANQMAIAGDIVALILSIVAAVMVYQITQAQVRQITSSQKNEKSNESFSHESN